MTARRLAFALALPVSAAIASAIGCSSPSSNELFAQNGISSGASANAGGSSGTSAGTDSVGSQTQIESGGSEAQGGSSGAGGSSPTSGSGGSEQTQGGSLAGGGGAAGQTQTAPPVIESCDMLDSAITNDLNGHCYRVNSEELTYTAAQDACQAAGGHLLTVTSSEENDFAHDLHDGEHWLGANDGRADTAQGVGDYIWIDQEEWLYSDWRDGQPNAVETDCPGRSGGGGCYEHCAYQTDEGDWVDRSCGHTIVSICEWEPQVP